MKVCCIFEERDAEKVFTEGNFEPVTEYPKVMYGHRLDENEAYSNVMGGRELLKCRKCGAYLLKQQLYARDMWEGCGDMEWTDIYPVDSPEDADRINREFPGRLRDKLDRPHFHKFWEKEDFDTGEPKTYYLFYPGKTAKED